MALRGRQYRDLRSRRSAFGGILRSVIRSVPARIHATVNRQDDSRHPVGVGQVQHSVGNIFRCAVASEWLHAVERFELFVTQIAVQRRGNNARRDCVDANIFRRQFD